MNLSGQKLRELAGRPWFAALTLTLIAAALRFWMIDRLPPGLYQDEAWNGNDALQAWRTGQFQVFYEANFGREGLFINLQALALGLFGAHIWVLRAVSAFFGTLTVPGLYLLVRELLRGSGRTADRTAWWAAFFLAVGFWHLSASRVGLRMIMAPFLLCWSMYFLLRAVRSPAAGRRAVGAAVGWAALSGLLCGAGFHTYISFRIAPLILAAAFIIHADRWRDNKRQLAAAAAAFALAALAAAAPLLSYFWQHPAQFNARIVALANVSGWEAWRLGIGSAMTTLAMFATAGDQNWVRNLPAWPALDWPVATLFIIGLVLAIVRIGAGRNGRALLSRSRWLILIALAGYLPIFAAYALELYADHFGSLGAAHLLGELALVGAIGAAVVVAVRRRSDLSTGENGNQCRFAPIIILWLALGALPHILSRSDIPHFWRALIVAPAACALAANGLEYLLRGVDTGRFRIKAALSAAALTLAALAAWQYFGVWGPDPRAAQVFAADLVAIGRELEALPMTTAKYVVVERGPLMNPIHPIWEIQTIVFVTDTATVAEQEKKNFHYVESDGSFIAPDGSAAVYLESPYPTKIFWRRPRNRHRP